MKLFPALCPFLLLPEVWLKTASHSPALSQPPLTLPGCSGLSSTPPQPPQLPGSYSLPAIQPPPTHHRTTPAGLPQQGIAQLRERYGLRNSKPQGLGGHLGERRHTTEGRCREPPGSTILHPTSSPPTEAKMARHTSPSSFATEVGAYAPVLAMEPVRGSVFWVRNSSLINRRRIFLPRQMLPHGLVMLDL